MTRQIKYFTPNQIYKKYGYHPKTTVLWSDQGIIPCIKSPGGHRRYPESEFEDIPKIEKERILYARVSTRTQLADLDTQIDFLGKAYPGGQVIKDVGSGMNWKRKGFLKSNDQSFSWGGVQNRKR